MSPARLFSVAFFAVALAVPSRAAETRTVWLDELELSPIRQGWGEPQVRKSVVGRAIVMNGTAYERGVGSHAAGVIYVELDGQAERFQAVVGVDDETQGRGSVTVKAYSDTKKLFESGVLRGGQPPVEVDLDIAGSKRLILIMEESGDDQSYDHVDWADARFLVAGADPKIVERPHEEIVIRTPPPPNEPRINGARVCGVRPGSPFIYRIPATGIRPMKFSVKDLPEGLAVDTTVGIITGTIADKTKRVYDVTFVAENGHGKAERGFTIVVGDTLALTPPMGWNHWYTFYNRITGEIVRQAADAMVASGMADVGYNYVNIDDCWMNAPEHEDPNRVGPLRDETGNMLPNSYFPDMPALVEYIHAKGLKAGLYTSPGPLTCAGFAGSYEHERQDAERYAEWGFDFLKYDWCSYGKIAKDDSLEELKKPYILMGDILKTLDRDIILNLCQYGMGDVWKWGEEVGGQCWRTAGDLGFELDRYHAVARRNAGFREYARPGAWNDPDYLLLGVVGSRLSNWQAAPCPLTPNQQYSYMSLWVLMASPLFFTGDMSELDAFTLNVLCNPEVIDINQDPLGEQGYPIVEGGEWEVWKKPLGDGSAAVGLFNRSEVPQTVTARWNDLGLDGKQAVRDVWRHKDLGEFDAEYSVEVGRLGVELIRVCPVN